MPKYNESKVVGESWTRSFQIVGWNHYGEAPGIRYDEEKAIQLDGGTVVTVKEGNNVGTRLTLDNATEQFQLRDPQTDEFIDAYATYQDFFVLVYSLYFHLAKKRDRGPQPYPSWTWNETNQVWEAPVPSLGDGYVWNEATQGWEPAQG